MVGSAPRCSTRSSFGNLQRNPETYRIRAWGGFLGVGHHVVYAADHYLFDERMMRIRSHAGYRFSSISDMNDAIVEEHNRNVRTDTDVYVIGDFATNGTSKELRKCFEKMNGSKHLIVGHRNTRDVYGLKWSSIRTEKEHVERGVPIYLSHNRSESWPGIFRGGLHLHGRVYSSRPPYGRTASVRIDEWDLGTVTAEDAVRRMIGANENYGTYIAELSDPILNDEDNWIGHRTLAADNCGAHVSSATTDPQHIFSDRAATAFGLDWSHASADAIMASSQFRR
jgi:calcineurin-like phosphoesterase family protein